MTFAIVDGWAPDDSSLECSRWIAERTAERHPNATVLRDRHATRAGLSNALSDPEIVGVALFGHGEKRAFSGADGKSALDADNVDLLRDRWAHAVACLTGCELAGIAASVGVKCYVGYDASLIVDWTPTELPSELSGLFACLVCETTDNLVAGEHDKTILKRKASAAADRVEAWIQANPELSFDGIQIAAQQLVDRMIVRQGATRDR